MRARILLSLMTVFLLGFCAYWGALISCDGSSSDEALPEASQTSSDTGDIQGSDIPLKFTLHPPTIESVQQAMMAVNSYGVVPKFSFNPVEIPPCTTDEPLPAEVAIKYAIENLPSWLEFQPGVRTLVLKDNSKVPDDAFSTHKVKYVCRISSSHLPAVSIDFNINDVDQGGLSDGYEYYYSYPPVINKIGYFLLNEELKKIYKGYSFLPNEIIYSKRGLDFLNPSDDLTDLDNDGANNYEESMNGTNPYIATFGSGDWVRADGGRLRRNTSAMVSADFDQDGWLDLAMAHPRNNRVGIFFNNGHGFFEDSILVVPPGEAMEVTGIVAADFNSDGTYDLATTNVRDNSVSVLINRGNRIFEYLGSPVPVGRGPLGIIAQDFDNNATIDLAVSNSGGFESHDHSVSILLGNGDGTFVVREGAVPTVLNVPYGLTSVDFNSDGNLDLVVTNRGVDWGDTRVTIFLGNGNGTFGNISPSFETGQNPTGIVSADFNNDSFMDIAVTNYAFQDGRTITILLGSRSGSFVGQPPIPTQAGAYAISAADLNGDNFVDIAVTHMGRRASGKTSSIFYGKGDGSFGSENVLNLPTVMNDGEERCGPTAIATADLDNNGSLEVVVVCSASENIHIFRSAR